MDHRGRLVKTENPLGEAVILDFDELGNPVAVTGRGRLLFPIWASSFYENIQQLSQPHRQTVDKGTSKDNWDIVQLRGYA